MSAAATLERTPMPSRLDTRPATDDDEDRERMYGPHVPNREEIDAAIRDAQEKTARELETREAHEDAQAAREASYRALYEAAADVMGVNEMARVLGIPESSFRTYVADLARARRAREKRRKRGD